MSRTTNHRDENSEISIEGEEPSSNIDNNFDSEGESTNNENLEKQSKAEAKISILRRAGCASVLALLAVGGATSVYWLGSSGTKDETNSNISKPNQKAPEKKVDSNSSPESVTKPVENELQKDLDLASIELKKAIDETVASSPNRGDNISTPVSVFFDKGKNQLNFTNQESSAFLDAKNGFIAELDRWIEGEKLIKKAGSQELVEQARANLYRLLVVKLEKSDFSSPEALILSMKNLSSAVDAATSRSFGYVARPTLEESDRGKYHVIINEYKDPSDIKKESNSNTKANTNELKK